MTGHLALLADLAGRGVEISPAEGGKMLRYRGPSGAVTPTHLAALRAYKSEILATLLTRVPRWSREIEAAIASARCVFFDWTDLGPQTVPTRGKASQ